MALLSAMLYAGEECQTFLAKGRTAYQERQYAAAAAEFEQAVRACGASKPLLFDLAQTQMLAREFSKSLGTLEQLLALDARNVLALKLKSDMHYLMGHDREAEQSLLTAAEIDPRNVEVIYALGRIYYQQNRFEDAVKQFKRVLDLDPKSYKAYDNLGLAYEGLNDNQQAIRNYLKALDLVHKDHPEYDWVYGNLANLMIKLGDYKKAFDLGVEASKRNPNSPRNFFLTGKALVKLDKYDLSLRWLKHAIELDPDYPEPHYLLAQAYKKLGKEDEARAELKTFQQASAKTPQKRR